MGPMIDVYCEEITAAISSGDSKLIADIAETFLSRCHYYRRWQIEGVRNHICPSDGLQVFISIRFSDGKAGEVKVGYFRGKRRLMVDSEVAYGESSADVVHALGVPCCFFDGIYYAAECFHEAARIDVAEKTQESDRQYIKSRDRLVQVQGSLGWYAKSLDETMAKIDTAKNALSAAVDRVRVAGEIESVAISPVDWKSRLGEAAWAMQTAAPSFISLQDAKRLLLGKSGIYFGWRITDGKCVYVGKSKNLGSRLHGGRTELLDCKVSYIEMPEDQIHTWELFYIWLHHPERNNEVRKATDAAAVCDAECLSNA